MNSQPLTAQQIAERGMAIYRRKYSAEFERKWRGRFVAIDIATEIGYVADYPEQAFSDARKAAPNGLFYLVRIGSLGIFRTGRRVFNADSRLF